MFKKIMGITTLALFYLLTTSSISAKKEVNVTTTKLDDKIYMLAAEGGNVGVFIGKDGTFVIDDQFAPLSEKLLAAIKKLGGDTPKFLINTHFHADHTGGNENFGKKGALIVAHDKVRERLLKGSLIKAFNMKTSPAPKAALPVITYSKDMHFHINNDEINIIHVPNAHTDGDSFIHFKKSNVVHTGDIFFNGFYPFIDPDNGGSLKGMINAVDIILALTDADSKIIPGHGPLADKKQLEDYRKMLKTAHANLVKLKDMGLSAEQAKAKKPLETLDARWGKGLFTSDRWIEVVYPAVSK